LLSLPLHASLALAFSPPPGLPFRLRWRVGFFSEEYLLAPLAFSSSSTKQKHQRSPAALSNATIDTMSSWTIPYSRQDHGVETAKDADDSALLPVLYTNDPKMVNRWLTENIPMDVTAIGFDTEVRGQQ
jgi:hypothetical protein